MSCGALRIVHAAFAGDEHVEVADGFAAAAQRAGGRDLLDALDVLQMLGQLLRGAVGFVEQEAAGDAAIILDRLQDFLLALFAQARQLAQLAFARQFLHAGEVADLEGAPQQRDGLGAESLDLQQLQHRGPVFLQQLLMRAPACRRGTAPGCWPPCLCRCREFPAASWARRAGRRPARACASSASAARR